MNEIKVLDKGFVRFVDMMGGDMGVVQAARVSYKSDQNKTEEENRKLIAYLLKNHHGSPFEHAVFKFHVKLPIFVARQWIRHRTSSYNETSFRYREAPEEFYIPAQWRGQDVKNKQGSLGSVTPMDDAYAHTRLVATCQNAMKDYKGLIDSGISREMARMVLPVNLYTEWYWTVNTRALMNFITLRSDSHAQWEIRQYSHVLASIFSEKMPWTWEAFTETLSRDGGYNEMFYYLAPVIGGCEVVK